jgi:hypothetical protein
MILLSINVKAYESTFSVTIPKEIVLDGDTKTATYNVDVKGSIQSGETAIVSVIPSTSFSLSNIVANGYPTKEAISAQVSQNVTSWTYNDIMKGATTSGKITANDISAGDWSGSLNFNVKFDVNSMTINVTNGEATYDGNATNGDAKVEVTSPTSGATIKYGTTNGTYDLDEIPTYTNPGTYEVYYKIEASNYTTKTGSLTITINEGLNGYTWDEVSNICAKGEAKEYFNVGDEAIICLDEMDTMIYNYVGTLGETTTLGKQTATIVVGDMTNTSLTLLFVSYETQTPAYQMGYKTDEHEMGTYIGGWRACMLRTWLNSNDVGGFYNALSSSLKNAITTHITSYSETYDATNVSYCEDKLWLLSAKEVFGGDIATSAGENTSYENLAAFNSEKQLPYFADNNNSKILYLYGTTKAWWWWLRSSNYASDAKINNVREYGTADNYHSVRSSACIFPAFTIGQPSLNDYSWSEIQGICKLGLANEYFGDCIGQEVTIELGSMDTMTYGYFQKTLGTTFTLATQTATMVVANVSSDCVTMFFTNYSVQAPAYQMIPDDTNEGGWEVTILREWLNNESEGGFYNALPSELKNVIKTHSSSYSKTYDASEVSYCDDKLWLLSEKEVFGDATYAENKIIAKVESQLAYFANGGSTIRYLYNNTTAVGWRLRSTHNSSYVYFGDVNDAGNIGAYFAYYAHCVFPAFDIG